jgi:hypothetical protein
MTTTMPDHGGLPRREDDRPWTDPTLPTAERVEALLARLTLPEKVTQLSSNHFGRVGDLDETARHGLGRLTRPYGTLPRPATGRAGCPTSTRHRRSPSGTARRTRPAGAVPAGVRQGAPRTR